MGGGAKINTVLSFLFFHSSVSPASLGAVDNSLSGNQMLIKRKLHSIGGQQNRKETLPCLPLPSPQRSRGVGRGGGRGQERDSSVPENTDVRNGDGENGHQKQPH